MSSTTSTAISARLESVRACIAGACDRAGRDPAEVTLIGVSKTFPAETVAEAVRAGLRDTGENRVQEGLPKAAALAEMGLHPTWHLVGHLQTNKVRKALERFTVIHSVDSERLLREIGRVAEAPVQVFLEVNVSGEESKLGVTPDDLPRLHELAMETHHVEVAGLMTVAPLVATPEEARPVFRALHELAASRGLHGLSMGMTNDFEVAIEEGATHVRVGRAIFGERDA